MKTLDKETFLKVLNKMISSIEKYDSSEGYIHYSKLEDGNYSTEIIFRVGDTLSSVK